MCRSVGGRSEGGRTELVCLYELLLAHCRGGWRSLADDELGCWTTAGRHLLVGLDGGDGGDGGDGVGARGHKLNTGTEGLGRRLVTGGQTEVTGHLDTQTVGLQVLLTESATSRSADIARGHTLSESKE